MKKIAFLCFFLAVLPLTAFSIPVDLSPSKQTDRKDSYNSLFSLITKLSTNVEAERNEFLNLSKLEDKTSKDKKLEIDKKKLDVDNLVKSLNIATQHYGNLTNEKNHKLTEKNKILNSIKVQQIIIQHELNSVNNFYNESVKFKTYQEYSAINKEIDDLKSSISKESSDIQQKYLDLLKKIQLNINDKDVKISVAKEDVRVINKNVEDSSKNLDDLKKQFELFLSKYRVNLKNRDVINKNFNDEIIMLKNVLLLLKNNNLNLNCSKSFFKSSTSSKSKVSSSSSSVQPKSSPTPTSKASPTPTPNASPTPTSKSSPTPTPTSKASPTPTPNASPTPAPTSKSSPTPTPNASPTPAPTSKSSPTPAPTSKSSPTPAPTSKSSPTPAPTSKASPTPTPVSVIPSASEIMKARNERSKSTTLSANDKKIADKRDADFNKWLLSKDGIDASNFCMSLGIHNKPSIFGGCLEDMMSTGDKQIAKDSAIMEEEFASKDKQSSTASTSKRYCVAAGDPHFVNYDGEVYHLQEQGIYTLAKTTGFEVQEKTKKNGANIPGVPSCMIGVVIKSGGVTVEIDVNNLKSVLTNGKLQDLPQDFTIKVGGVSIRYGKQVIEWHKDNAKVTALKITGLNGFSVLVVGGYCGTVEINVPKPYYGKMQGLCGNADGIKDNSDYKDPSGKILDVKRGTRNWEMSGYGGPTSPLSKWQLSWKSTGADCLFSKDC
jgi:hypothetical protein